MEMVKKWGGAGKRAACMHVGHASRPGNNDYGKLREKTTVEIVPASCYNL